MTTTYRDYKYLDEMFEVGRPERGAAAEAESRQIVGDSAHLAVKQMTARIRFSWAANSSGG
jgi:hypothetical protein